MPGSTPERVGHGHATEASVGDRAQALHELDVARVRVQDAQRGEDRRQDRHQDEQHA